MCTAANQQFKIIKHQNLEKGTNIHLTNCPTSNTLVAFRDAVTSQVQMHYFTTETVANPSAARPLYGFLHINEVNPFSSCFVH